MNRILIAAFMALAAACVTPTKPPTPPTQPTRNLSVWVRAAATGQPIAAARVTTVGQGTEREEHTSVTGLARLLGLRVVPFQVCAWADGFVMKCAAVGQGGDHDVFLDREAPTFTPAPRLRDVGGSFVDPDGTIFKWHGITAFTALGDWLAGRREKLTDYADKTQARGVNVWRVFSLWVNTDLKPGPGYYDGLREFLTWARDRGIYVQLVAFCDQVPGSSVLLPAAQQEDHLRQIIAISRDVGNVFLEVSNED